jgi:MFS transporter, APGE family, 1-arseno-3-phosphoglycerate exporter
MTELRNYAVVTAAYWGFTLTDGALRMLVLLHFYNLGYTPFELALLFLLYEFMGIVTNLLGGWIGSRVGLRLTLQSGLALQVAALLALSALDPAWTKALSVAYVLTVQGLSGVAKDLTKMSSKSAIKLMLPEAASARLFKWVALLTGSKNALKGAGFFLGGLLLALLGFRAALWAMAGALAAVLVFAVLLLPRDLGRAKAKAKFAEILSKSPAVNLLSAARVFLFGARDVWFVVGLPVYLYDVLGWSFTQVGAFLALWIVGYGGVQGVAPHLTRRSADGRSAEIRAAQLWIFALALVSAGIAAAVLAGAPAAPTLVLGLAVFGFVFAVNSSLHSYLILALSTRDRVALNVGFYYMANAAGRLAGTLLSGLAYQAAGLAGCLATAAGLLLLAGGFTLALGPAARRHAAELS